MRSRAWKKCLWSSHPTQVDFPPSVQVTFYSYFPDGKVIKQVICQLNQQKSHQGKQHVRASYPKGNLEFKFFFQVLGLFDNKSTSLWAFIAYVLCFSWQFTESKTFNSNVKFVTKSQLIWAVFYKLVQWLITMMYYKITELLHELSLVDSCV